MPREAIRVLACPWCADAHPHSHPTRVAFAGVSDPRFDLFTREERAKIRRRWAEEHVTLSALADRIGSDVRTLRARLGRASGDPFRIETTGPPRYWVSLAEAARVADLHWTGARPPRKR